MSSSDKIQQQVIFTIFNTIFEDFIMGIISAARIFIASLFNPASIPSLFFFTSLLRACSEYYPPAAKRPLLKPFLSVPPSLLILA